MLRHFSQCYHCLLLIPFSCLFTLSGEPYPELHSIFWGLFNKMSHLIKSIFLIVNSKNVTDLYGLILWFYLPWLIFQWHFLPCIFVSTLLHLFWHCPIYFGLFWKKTNQTKPFGFLLKQQKNKFIQVKRPRLANSSSIF